MWLQLAVSLRLFVGGGRSQHPIAMRPAGRSQVLAGVLVFTRVSEWRSG